MSNIAIYPGTFDPLTNGHVDIVERGAKIFDIIIVAVAESARKQPQFSIDKRLLMCREVFKTFENIQVFSFDGLLVEFARSKQARYVVRGLRGASDVALELELASMNRQLAPEIETVFVPASSQTARISSTIVREIINMGGDVSAFVPPAVGKVIK